MNKKPIALLLGVLAILFIINSFTEMYNYLVQNNYDLLKMFTDEASTINGRYFLSDLLFTLCAYIIILKIDYNVPTRIKIYLLASIFIVGLAFSVCMYGIVKCNDKYQKNTNS